MYRSKMSAVFAVFALACMGLITDRPNCFAQNAPTDYEVQIVITVKGPDGQNKVIRLPAVTIQAGNPHRYTLSVGNDTFESKSTIKPDGQQVMTAKTTANLKLNGKTTAMPPIEQALGQSASIESGDIVMQITVKAK